MTSATTEAAVLVETGKPLDLMILEIPALKPGQVLVDLVWSGVCHSQLNEARGRRGPDRFLPHTLGHEGAGTVAAVGEGVVKVKPGDRVVLTWIKGMGADVPSTVYGSAIGPVNSGAISTFMRRTVTCESRVVPVSDSIGLREAALLGCAVPTGGGIVRNTARVKAGDSVAVFGTGGIGLSAVMMAAGLGASPVIAIDVVAEKLEMARRMGATHTVDASRTEPLAAVLDITGGGVDLAVEAAGRPVVMETAFKAVRKGGGLCVLAGNVAAGERIGIDPYDLIVGRRLLGSWGGDTVPDRDIPDYAAMIAEGRLRAADLITHEYGLSDINVALSDLESARVGRALLNLSA